MAISKSLLMKNGVTATYWKIISVHVDVQILTSSFVIAPFLDETNADGGSKPVGPSKTYLFSIDSADDLAGNLSDAYDAILAKAASTVPNIGSGGTHTYDTDLSDGTII